MFHALIHILNTLLQVLINAADIIYDTIMAGLIVTRGISHGRFTNIDLCVFGFFIANRRVTEMWKCLESRCHFLHHIAHILHAITWIIFTLTLRIIRGSNHIFCGANCFCWLFNFLCLLLCCHLVRWSVFLLVFAFIAATACCFLPHCFVLWVALTNHSCSLLEHRLRHHASTRHTWIERLHRLF